MQIVTIQNKDAVCCLCETKGHSKMIGKKCPDEIIRVFCFDCVSDLVEFTKENTTG